MLLRVKPSKTLAQHSGFGISDSDITVAMCDGSDGTTALGILVTINRLSTDVNEESIDLTIVSSGSGDTSSIDDYTQPPGGVPSGTGTTVNVCHHLKDNYPGGDTITATITASGTARIPATVGGELSTTMNITSGTLTGMVMVEVPPPEASIAINGPGGSAGASATVVENGDPLTNRRATLTFTLAPAPVDGTVLAMVIMGTPVMEAGTLFSSDDVNFLGMADFNLGVNTVTIANVTFNSGTATTQIQMTNDMVDDDGEGYTLALMAAAGYTIGDSGHTVTLNIEDDDVPAVADGEFTATAGSAQVTLTWTNPTDAELDALIISATAGGTAFNLTGGTSSISGLAIAVETSADGNDLKITAAPGGMLSGQAGNVTVTGLTDITEYAFSIVAVDEKGMTPDIRTYRSEPCCTPPVTATPTEALAPGVSLSPDVAVTDAAVGFTVQLDAANRPDIATEIEVTVQLTGAGVRGVGETDGAMETVTIEWDPDNAESYKTTLSLSRNFSTIGVDGTITATVQVDPLGNDYIVGSTPSATSTTLTDSHPTFEVGDMVMQTCTNAVTTLTALGIVVTFNRLGTHLGAVSITTLTIMSGQTGDAASIEPYAPGGQGVLADETTIDVCRHFKDNYPGGDTVTASITATDMFRVPSTDNPDTENMATGSHTNTYMVPTRLPMASITITPPGGIAGATATVPEVGSAVQREARVVVTLNPAPALNSSVTLSFTSAAIGTAANLGVDPNVDVFIAGTTSITFESDQTTATVVDTYGASGAGFGLRVLTDTMDDDGEGYTLTLVATDDYTVGSMNSVTLNIDDDDVPAITDLAATVGGASKQVMLTWTNPVDAELDSVKISVTAADFPIPYSVIYNGVTIPAGADNFHILAVTPSTDTTPSQGTAIATGLANGTEFTFTIVAVDNKDSGRRYESSPDTVNATPRLP